MAQQDRADMLRKKSATLRAESARASTPVARADYAAKAAANTPAAVDRNETELVRQLERGARKPQRPPTRSARR